MQPEALNDNPSESDEFQSVNEFDLHGEENSEECFVYEEESEEGHFGNVEVRIHADAEVRFREWMEVERKWIELFMRFGVKLTVMDAILRLLRAPFKTTQIRRNLENYTQFYPIRYISCRGHRLLEEESKFLQCENKLPSGFRCEICVSSSQQDLIAFQYLPLEPTLRAWVAEEKSSRTLFEYYQTQSNESVARRETEKMPYTTKMFLTVLFSRELFRRTGESRLRSMMSSLLRVVTVLCPIKRDSTAVGRS